MRSHHYLLRHVVLLSDESFDGAEAVKLLICWIEEEDELYLRILHLIISASIQHTYQWICMRCKIIRQQLHQGGMLQNRRNWSDFEDRAIVALVKKYGTKNWAEISEKMSSKYGVDTRTGKQCRERWHNHLNPEVKKDKWTPKEEKIMFEAHQKYGNKWTQIAKIFEGRTDNDIKNHFYSMLRRSLRRVNKLLGMRNSTKKVRLIKPSVLSKIFANNGNAETQESEDWRKISQALFQFSKSKSVDDLSNNLEEEEKANLEVLIEKIAMYNEEYENSQMVKKESRISSGKEDREEAKEDLDVRAAPIFKKKSSNHSVDSQTSNKNKKIKQGIKKPAKQDKKQNQKGRKKKEGASTTEQPKPAQVQPTLTSRIKKKQSLKPQQIQMPDIFDELGDIQQLTRKRSSLIQLKRGSSSSSPNFYLNPSPRMQLRTLGTTPQYPTPDMNGLFSRNFYSYDWKDNNEDLDNILNQTRRAIQKKTNRS